MATEGLVRATDPLVEACGQDPGSLCEWVFERTDSHDTAVVADWLIGKPLAILAVIVVAWLFRWLAKRSIKRVVYRIMNPTSAVVEQLGALGLGTPKALRAQADDPRRRARATTVAVASTNVVTVVISVMAFLVIVGIVGVQLAPLIAGAGVAGVAIAFGAQSLVKDCINGLFILLEDQFGIGDTVTIGGVQGVIEKISLRATVLRAGDGTVWHIPNSQILQVGNASHSWSLAIVDVTVAHGNDLGRALAVLKESTEAICADPARSAAIVEQPELLGVEAFSPTGTTLRVTVKTTPGQQGGVERSLREAIHRAFAANGIEFPPSHRDGAPGQPLA